MCKGKPALALSFIAWLDVSVSSGQNPQRALISEASSTGLWKEIRVFEVYHQQDVRSRSKVKKEGTVDAVPS